MNIVNRFKQKIIHEYNERYRYPALVKGQKKIFCIGRNKTGTTSFKKAFEDLGFIVGNQRKAERLLPYYKENNFKKIVDYCKTAQVFQDFPFSFPKTYKHLDEFYPDSKFVLTVRDSPEQWYNSLIKFHSKLFGNGNVPNKKDLQSATYVWKGWIWECNRMMYGTPEDDPYNKSMMIKTYKDYNRSVMKYFKDRSKDLIVINLSKKDSYNRLMDYLNIDSPYTEFPWSNKTEQVGIKQ